MNNQMIKKKQSSSKSQRSRLLHCKLYKHQKSKLGEVLATIMVVYQALMF